ADERADEPERAPTFVVARRHGLGEVEVEARHLGAGRGRLVALGRDGLDPADLEAARRAVDLHAIPPAPASVEGAVGVALLDVAGGCDGVGDVRRGLEVGVLLLVGADAVAGPTAPPHALRLDREAVGDAAPRLAHAGSAPRVGRVRAGAAVEGR